MEMRSKKHTWNIKYCMKDFCLNCTHCVAILLNAWIFAFFLFQRTSFTSRFQQFRLLKVSSFQKAIAAKCSSQSTIGNKPLLLLMCFLLQGRHLKFLVLKHYLN